ncbi:uncharacterized protein CTRU02_207856 [Colletotrichum truncatum]|uniref:Uncharacterized protein n=1 Tax=Colletotrichum truncatum TaxID=5467 RepID=A0ACC3Z226_COLTU|nr:uncharacterized protein CTRU02_15560 [Colletotrichum truncatum]KAF6780903.1 hypothetical protein CTRU02_15560 [Colletotrichum truncatum]
MRGLPCNGQPSPQTATVQARSTSAPAPSGSVDDSILGRLRKLEQAVFGSGPAAENGASTDLSSTIPASSLEDGRRRDRHHSIVGEVQRQPPSRLPRRSLMNSERQQTAKFLDSTFTRYGLHVSLPHDKVDYRVANFSQFPKTPSSTATGLTPTEIGDGRPSTWLMTQKEALNFLDDFISNPFHLLPIIHVPATRSVINAFYTSLSQGEDPNPAHAALILGIAATSAFFFSGNSEASNTFTSSEEATKTALTWVRSVLNIFEQSPPCTLGCLEEVQARVILSYLVYNFEGCSGRFRFLHSCSVAAAREGSLHIVDSPSLEQQNDAVTREIKRRIWWHIVATDWMLGLMGGPTDGTYSVHPRHMNVRYPRNINDDDESLLDETINHPPDVATNLSCFLRRIQLGEISRSIIDARAPGNPETEIADPDQVLQLDRLFSDVLSELPPFLKPDGPIPPGAPPYLALQRDVVLLGFHSRRARLHRPFLLHETQDAANQQSRDICLHSARIVLSIATRLLKSSQTRQSMPSHNTRAMGRRLGCVIGHMFMVCTILALNAGVETSRKQHGVCEDGAGTVTDATADTHAEVAEACRALATAGEVSAVAARLVHNLASVLRRYRVQGVDDVGVAEPDRPPEASSNVLDDLRKEAPSLSGGVNGEDHESGIDNIAMANGDFGLDGLWDGLVADTSTAYGWDQLFAGLDSYCGPT